MTDKKLTTGKFLDAVYSWLTEDRNRSVEDFHYSAAEVEKPENFKKTISDFLSQRFFQMYGQTCADPQFLKRATNKYIHNMFC